MREKIDLRDLLGDNFEYYSIWEAPEGFKRITETIVSTDSEKGSSDRIIILQRIEDKKFFKLEVTTWMTSSHEINPILKEVFPRDIVTTVYE
jgi:hypothetical protein